MRSYKLRHYKKSAIILFIGLALSIPLVIYFFHDLLVRYHTEWSIMHFLILAQIILYVLAFLLLWWIVSTELVISKEYIELFIFNKSRRIMFDDICIIMYKSNGVYILSKSGKRLIIWRKFECFDQLKEIIESRSPNSVSKSHSFQR